MDNRSHFNTQRQGRPVAGRQRIGDPTPQPTPSTIPIPMEVPPLYYSAGYGFLLGTAASIIAWSLVGVFVLKAVTCHG